MMKKYLLILCVVLLFVGCDNKTALGNPFSYDPSIDQDTNPDIATSESYDNALRWKGGDSWAGSTEVYYLKLNVYVDEIFPGLSEDQLNLFLTGHDIRSVNNILYQAGIVIESIFVRRSKRPNPSYSYSGTFIFNDTCPPCSPKLKKADGSGNLSDNGRRFRMAVSDEGDGGIAAAWPAETNAFAVSYNVGRNLIAHEIGHVFSLWHTNNFIRRPCDYSRAYERVMLDVIFDDSTVLVDCEIAIMRSHAERKLSQPWISKTTTLSSSELNLNTLRMNSQRFYLSSASSALHPSGSGTSPRDYPITCSHGERKMKKLTVLSLVLFVLACSNVHVNEIENKSIEYQHPDYKWVLMSTTSNIYATKKDEPESWIKVAGENSDPDRTFTDTKDKIEQIYASEYCNGIWVAVGITYNVDWNGTKQKANFVVYWIDRQSPVGDWTRNEIKSPSSGAIDNRMIVQSVTCDTESGTFYVAAWDYFIYANDPSDPDSWVFTRTRKLVTLYPRPMKLVYYFGGVLYGAFIHPSQGFSILGLLIPGESEWKFTDVQEDIGGNPAEIHTGLFDPIDNSVVFGTTWPYVIYCQPGTLECSKVDFESNLRSHSSAPGVDSIGTNYKGDFFGLSVTQGQIQKRPGKKWLRSTTSQPAGNYGKIKYLNGIWFAGGAFGQLIYNDSDNLSGSSWKRVAPLYSGFGIGTSIFGNRDVTSLTAGGL